MEGIETVVVNDDIFARVDTTQKDALSYKKFPDMIVDVVNCPV
jgi:hypothetical protein